MKVIKLDNTKRSMFKSCKRKYQISEILGYKSDFGSTAIRLGVAYHGMQEGFAHFVKAVKETGDELNLEQALAAGIKHGKKKWDKECELKTFAPDYRTFEACCQLFANYHIYYANDLAFIEIVETEQKFECMIEPENEVERAIMPSGYELVFTGRIDLQVKMDGMKWIFDHKSTSQALSIQGSRLNRSAQLKGYSYAGERILDFKPEGCLVALAHISSYKSKKTGEYGDVKTDFLRVPQIFSKEDLAQWKLSFIDTYREIVFSLEHDWWPMNDDSCYQYGQCQFARICEQNRPLDETNFTGYHIEHWDVLDED